MRWVLLVGRILFGGFFLSSGLNHFSKLESLAGYAQAAGVPSPTFMVAVSGLLLIIGGVSVLTGIAPRIGLAALVLFLVPVTLTMHRFWGLNDPQQQMMQMGNFMKNVALTGAALGLMAVPVPWPLALDGRIEKRWPRWTRVTGFHRPLHQP